MTARTVAGTSPVAIALATARHARGLSRERLAALAGISSRTIYAIEVEQVRPQRATRHVLAIALGVEVAELFDHEPLASGLVKDGGAAAPPRD